MKSSKLLFDEKPIVLSRALSRILGPSRAIALQQIHYWCEKSKDFANPHEHFIDGKWWVYNTYQKWQEQFEIGSERTVRRVLKELEREGLILVGNHHRNKSIQTKWYAINHENLDKLYDSYYSSAPSGQTNHPSGQIVNTSGQVVKTVDNVTSCTSGQSVKSNDKVATCIKDTEITQNLSELTQIDLFKAYTQNPKLLMSLELFYEMRLEMNKKLTLAATKMLLDDLDTMAESDDDKIAILRKSVLNNWKEIFPPKSDHKSQRDHNIEDATSRIEAEMKRRGEYNPSVGNPEDYYDWIGQVKSELELD